MRAYFVKDGEDVKLTLTYRIGRKMSADHQCLAAQAIYFADAQKKPPSDPESIIKTFRDNGISGEMAAYTINYELYPKMPKVIRSHENGFIRLTIVRDGKRGESVLWNWKPEDE